MLSRAVRPNNALHPTARAGRWPSRSARGARGPRVSMSVGPEEG